MEEKVIQEEQNMNDIQDAPEKNADIHSEGTSENNDKLETETESPEAEIEKLQKQVDELKDKYLRQVADFDNFRKRTAKEKTRIDTNRGQRCHFHAFACT